MQMTNALVKTQNENNVI